MTGFSGIIGLELVVLVEVDAVEYDVEGVADRTIAVVPEPDATGLLELEKDGSEECVAECLPGNLAQNPSLLLTITIPSRLLDWLPAPSFFFSFFFSFSFSFPLPSFSFLFFSSFGKLFAFPPLRPPLSFLTKL